MGMETDWPTCCHMSGCAQSLCISFIHINKYIKKDQRKTRRKMNGGHFFPCARSVYMFPNRVKNTKSSRWVKAKIMSYNNSTMKYTRLVRWVLWADKSCIFFFWFELCSLIVYSYLSDTLKQAEILKPTENMFSITSHFWLVG